MVRNNSEFDIVLVGAGLIGTSLAHMLSGSGLKIGLIEEKNIFNSSSKAEDNRSIVLTHSSYQILKALGLWQALSNHAYPIKKVHVSQQRRFGTAKFSAADYRFPALGYVIPAQHLIKTIQDSLLQLNDVTFLSPAIITDIEKHFSSNGLILKVGDEITTINTQLLIAADGTNSKIRNFFSIPTHFFDYQQIAIICNIEIAAQHQNIAYERLTLSGPLAVLPRTENQCGVIFTVKNTQLETIKALSDELFLQELQQQFGYRLGKFLQVSKRHYYPMKMMYTDQQVRDNMVLVGNAAQTLHIIAGQGFNDGLNKAARLAECVLQSKSLKSALKKYQQWGHEDQHQIKNFTHRTVQLFTDEYLSRFANMGLMGISALPGMKNLLVKRLLGLTKTVPKLVCGVNPYFRL